MEESPNQQSHYHPRSTTVDLSQKLLEKNSKIGVLEAQNSLLKLKLRLTLREIDLLNNKIPSDFDREKYLEPEVKAISCQTDPVVMEKPPIPATPTSKRVDDDFLQASPAVTELNNTLSNLKWGFRKREDSLKQQLENHKEALYALYSSHEKLRKQYRYICNVICNKLEHTEEYVANRKEQSKLLENREAEIFILWEKLKQLEEYKSKYEALVDDNRIYSKDSVDSLEAEREERNRAKRIKSDDTEDSLSKSIHKRKLAEALYSTRSSDLPDLPTNQSKSGTIDQTTLLAMNKSTDQDDLFYNQHKGFSVNIDVLLPSSGNKKVSHFTMDKSGGMMLGDETDYIVEDAPAITDDFPTKSQSIESREEGEEDGDSENINDKTIEDIPDLNNTEYENKNNEVETEEENMDITDNIPVGGDDILEDAEDEETETPKVLEDLQESPIYKPTNDKYSEDDSEDSLYGLKAVLSPPSTDQKKLFNQTITQNLFGKDESSSASNKKTPRINLPSSQQSSAASKEERLSFEISSEDYRHPPIMSSSQHLHQGQSSSIAENYNNQNEEDDDEDAEFDLLDITKSNDGGSTQKKLLESVKKANPVIERVASAEIAIQTEDSFQKISKTSISISPIRDNSRTSSMQTEIIAQRDEGIQVKLETTKICKEIGIVTDEIPIAPVISAPIPLEMKEIGCQANLKEKEKILSAKSSEEPEFLQNDQEYYDEMQTIQLSLGEKLVELDFEKEHALKQFKAKMKHLLLSSTASQAANALNPVTLTPNISPEKLSLKGNEEEKKANLSDQTSTTENALETYAVPSIFTISDKELYEKQLFTAQEKIFHLTKDKENLENTLSIEKSNFENEKTLLNVKITELEKKNHELIHLINSLKPITSEISVQTDPRPKKYRLKIHHYGISAKEDEENEENYSDDDDEGEEDELSRLLFKDQTSTYFEKSKIGKMEFPVNNATNSKNDNVPEAADTNNNHNYVNNPVFDESNYEIPLPLATHSSSVKKIENEEELDDKEDEEEIEELEGKILVAKSRDISEQPLPTLVPTAVTAVLEEENKNSIQPARTLIRIPTFRNKTTSSQVKELAQAQLQQEEEEEEEIKNIDDAENYSIEEKSNQSYEELFHSRPSTKQNKNLPPIPHYLLQSSQNSSANNSVSNIFIKEHTIDPKGFISNYELYEDDQSNLNVLSTTGGAGGRGGGGGGGSVLGYGSLLKSGEASRRSSIQTNEEFSDDEADPKPLEENEMKTDSYDQYLNKKFGNLEIEFQKELSLIEEQNRSMNQGIEGIAYDDYEEIFDEENNWSTNYQRKIENDLLEQEFIQKEQQDKERKLRRFPKEEKAFESNVSRILTAATKLDDRKKFIRRDDHKNSEIISLELPQGKRNEQDGDDIEEDEEKKAPFSPKEYEIPDYSLLSSSFTQKLQEKKLLTQNNSRLSTSPKKLENVEENNENNHKDNKNNNNNNNNNQLNLESFEIMRIEWENQQLINAKNELIRENQKLNRELELYRTRIFTIINTEKSSSMTTGLQDLPDINITFHSGHQLQYLSQTTTTSQTLYIIHQLITNNNELIDKQSFYQSEYQRIQNQIQEKDQEIFYLIKELEKRELQNNRMKLLIQQASDTIMITEQDYQILQKQVEILTKKLQLVTIENQKLSSYYHINDNSNGSHQQQQQQQAGGPLLLTNGSPARANNVSSATSTFTFLPPSKTVGSSSTSVNNNSSSSSQYYQATTPSSSTLRGSGVSPSLYRNAGMR